jgi:hypothetical protein
MPAAGWPLITQILPHVLLTNRTVLPNMAASGAIGSAKINDLQMHFVPKVFGYQPFQVTLGLLYIFTGT